MNLSMVKSEDTATSLKLILPTAAILISVSIATYWAWSVPIFQYPNEDLHTDYMFCIYSRQKLIRPYAPKVYLAHSFTKYLSNATDAQLMEGNEFAKAPKDYGSKEFFRNLNLHAPKVEIIGCPGLAGRYPVGYYALTAFWITLVSLFNSSLTTLFFAARFFSVFLFAIGMAFSYLALRELGLSYWRASLAITAIGLLPLASFASSCIQPNNLSFAAVSACFFFALRWRNHTNNLFLVCLSVALTMLFLAKYQFYFCATLSIVIMIIAKDTLLRAMPVVRLRHLALTLIPSAVTGALQTWIYNKTWQYPVYLSKTKTAMYSGSANLKNQFWDSITSTLHSLLYFDGDCFKSFWRCFGLMDTPIIIGNTTFTHIFFDIIHVASIIITILSLVSLIRIWYSLLNLLRKRHHRLSFYIAFSNPLITSYFIFLLGIFALAFVSYGGFLLQGRHLFPFIVPLFWIVTMLAPRFLFNRNWRRNLFLLITIALLFYSLLGSYFTIKSIQQRYYGKIIPISIDREKLIPVPIYASCAIETCDYIRKTPSFEQNTHPLKIPLIVPSACPLIINGWAIDFPQRQLASAVLVFIDGKEFLPAVYGLESSIAVAALQDESYRYSGFGLIIPTKPLSPGWHILNLKVISNDKKFLYGTDKIIKFFISKN